MKTNIHRWKKDVYIFHNGLVHADGKLTTFLDASLFVLKDGENRFEHFEADLVAKYNFIVNLVTGIEMFFKVMIKDGQAWNQGGIKMLLDDSINLATAFDLFSTPDITKQYIVAMSHNFQDLEQIERIMGKLTHKKEFFEKLEQFKPVDAYQKPLKTYKISLTERYPDWKDTLTEIMAKRHAFVHTGQTSVIEMDVLHNYYFTVSYFGLCVYEFCKPFFKLRKKVKAPKQI